MTIFPVKGLFKQKMLHAVLAANSLLMHTRLRFGATPGTPIATNISKHASVVKML
jgi:hypothetical protein